MLLLTNPPPPPPTHTHTHTHTYCGGVSCREGIGAQSHEETGLANVRVSHHQDLEDIVGLGSKGFNELQWLQCVCVCVWGGGGGGLVNWE